MNGIIKLAVTVTGVAATGYGLYRLGIWCKKAYDKALADLNREINDVISNIEILSTKDGKTISADRQAVIDLARTEMAADMPELKRLDNMLVHLRNVLHNIIHDIAG